MKQFFKIIKKVDSFLKKAFIVFIVFFTIISLFFYFFTKNQPTQTHDIIKEERAKIYEVINDPTLKSTEEGRTKITVYRSFTCSVMGEGCTDNPEDGNKNFDKSVFGFAANLIVMPYANPVSSGVYWVRDGLQNAGFVPKTYAAQGIGYNALAPFKDIWIMLRNFVFMIMVLIIIAIGFMIMFRMKLNPQTVISIESALPKIVITLILITFSYPIAGFLIDLTYVTIGFVIILFSSNAGFGFNASHLLNKYFFSDTGTLWEDFAPYNGDRFNLIWQASSNFFGLLPVYLRQFIQVLTLLFGQKIGLAILGTKFPGFKFLGKVVETTDKTAKAGQPVISFIAVLVSSILVDLVAGDVIGQVVATAILVLFFLMSLLFIFFRIFFMILSSYLNILFMVIFSPLIIAIDAIPGKSTFSAWLKNLISNLLTFPLVIALVLITEIVLKTGSDGSVLWRPPYFFGLNPDAFKAIVAAGILFMIPNLIKLFKELLGFKPFPVSLGLGSMFTGGGAALGGAMGIMGQVSTISLAMNAFGQNGFFGQLLNRFKSVKEPRGQTGNIIAGDGQIVEAPEGKQRTP